MRVWIVIFLLSLMPHVAAYGERHGDDDWPMYGRNLEHTFSNPASRINPGNVASLQLTWTFVTGDAVSASPTVTDGVVYIGSWDGFFYALDARSGGLRWKFGVDCQNSVVPVPSQCLAPGQTPPPRFFTDGGLITSSAAVIAGKVYFAAGKTLYSLNAKDGSLRWKRVMCGNPDQPNCASDQNDPTRIFSSPTVFEDAIFVGWTADGVAGYRGGFAALDSETGRIRWRFEVDPILNESGQPLIVHGRVVGGQNRGCGSVWSSAAIDVDHHLVFFDTGDCKQDATTPYHEAVIALDTRTGRLRWAFRPRTSDPNHCDFDFGASANLIDADQGRYVGVGAKDGTYYLLNRLSSNPAGRLVWSRNVVFGGMAGGFFGAAAFNGSQLFSSTGIGDGNPVTQSGLCNPSNSRDTFIQEPSMHALDVGGGGVLWEQTMNFSFAPTTLAHDVVFSGTLGLLLPPSLNAYDARSGALLASFKMPGSVNSGATPVGDMVFVGSGNTNDGTGSGVHAFGLPRKGPVAR
ncbi:outer membrane protein assembly factor BamB family protein [Paraburkholderia xenovorans]|uniref:outer membrane protein assembly factor BamB family protein n=1 Tax=Paraburkholderia xenovorans TaxID=36873 RepID=UPI0038B77CBB